MLVPAPALKQDGTVGHILDQLTGSADGLSLGVKAVKFIISHGVLILFYAIMLRNQAR